MAGYVYRGNKPLLRDGFECGTRAGLLVHARLGTPLCGPCASIKAPVVKPTPRGLTARTHCKNGHDITTCPRRRCRTCTNNYMRERLTCQGCGNNMSRGSIYSHRYRHPTCADALMVKVAA